MVRSAKRFRFKETFDFFLLRASLKMGAHVARWRRAQALFERVAEFFLFSSHIKASISNPAVRPTWKSLNDRFKKLVMTEGQKITATALILEF